MKKYKAYFFFMLVCLKLCFFINCFSCSETLFDAIVRGDLNLVKDLIKKDGASLIFNHYSYNERYFNLRNKRCFVLGFSPAHVAAVSGCLNIMKYLIKKKGVDVNIESRRPDCKTLLHCASSEGHKDIVEYLVKKKAFLNKTFGNKEETALHCATKKGYYDIAVYLVEKGADINVKDYLGRTPIYWAINKKNFAFVRYLIENGAEPKLEINPESQEIAHYCKSIKVFDRYENKLKFITQKLSNKSLDKNSIKFLIYMALRRTLCLLNENDYCKLSIDLWKEMKSNKKLRDTVYNLFHIDKKKQYYNCIIAETIKMRVPTEKAFAISKNILSHICEKNFQQNLYKIAKNCKKSKEANNLFEKGDLAVRCIL